MLYNDAKCDILYLLSIDPSWLLCSRKRRNIMDEKKHLCKSRNNKKICGVCAGFADYLNLDPTLVRVLWALLAVFAGTGILAYFICALVMPEGDTEN